MHCLMMTPVCQEGCARGGWGAERKRQEEEMSERDGRGGEGGDGESSTLCGAIACVSQCVGLMTGHVALESETECVE